MTSPSARKGASAEREAARLLHDHLGWTVRRKLGAGRLDDCGDLDIVERPDVVVQVCSRSTDVVAVGVVRKPIEAEQQRINAGATFAFTLLRIRGGTWRAVLTVEQLATLLRETEAA